MDVYVEQDCTFTHEGRTFEAGGAYIAPDYLIAYPAADGILTDWHGQPLGTWRAVSSWRVWSAYGSHMYAIRCTIDGARYYGRGFGEGSVLRARRVKKELS